MKSAGNATNNSSRNTCVDGLLFVPINGRKGYNKVIHETAVRKFMRWLKG